MAEPFILSTIAGTARELRPRLSDDGDRWVIGAQILSFLDVLDEVPASQTAEFSDWLWSLIPNYRRIDHLTAEAVAVVAACAAGDLQSAGKSARALAYRVRVGRLAQGTLDALQSPAEARS